jgi:hypothetical protein
MNHVTLCNSVFRPIFSQEHFPQKENFVKCDWPTHIVRRKKISTSMLFSENFLSVEKVLESTQWPLYVYIMLKNSLIIHEENTKKNHKRVVSVYVIQSDSC